MDLFHELAARRQAAERLSNLALLSANSPTDRRIELVIVNDKEAGRLGSFVNKHSYLQEITLTFLDVTDPAKETACLIEYVRQHRPLTTLSLVTAFLLKQDGRSSLDERELVVDAFLKAAVENPSITSVSLNCCKYKYGRLAELVRKPGFKNLSFANCHSLDDRSHPLHKAEFLRALGGTVDLETFYMRKGCDPSSPETDVLLQLARLPKLREVGLSFHHVGTAITLRRLILTCFQRPMKFALLGSNLCEELATWIIACFRSRTIDFWVELKGCTWTNDSLREKFLEQLLLCPRLMKLSIDEHCGLAASRISYIQETVDLRYRIARLAVARRIERAHHVDYLPDSLF